MPPFSSVAGQVSLVIAITGHRDLDPVHTSWYRKRIGQIFCDLRTRYPETPLLLMSGLAEGADRIAVRAAIDHGIPFIAVLPMPEEHYRSDFVTEASDSEFVELRELASRSLTLPLISVDTNSADTAVRESARNAQYQALARFFVQYSQILIAIWDRDRTERKPGGTADLVMMKLRQGSSRSRHLSSSPLNTDGSGPVYILAGHRLGALGAEPPALACSIEYPDGVDPAVYESSYSLLDRFNGDIRRLEGRISGDAEVSGQDLMEGREPIDLSEAMKWVASVYARADRLAIWFNRQSLLLMQAVFVLIAVSGISISLIHAMDTSAWVLIVYYGGYAAAIGLIVWQHMTGRQSRHEDYRSLAEALRVQFFWMAAGLTDLAADKYLRKQADEMIWIRDALSECALYPNTLGLTASRASEASGGFDFAREWVKGQKKYFGNRARILESRQRAFRYFALTASAVGVIAPLAKLLRLPLDYDHASRAAAFISLVLAGLAWDYIERRGFMQEARQYTRMFALFRDAERDLGRFVQNMNFVSSEEIIRELGCEALAENGDWLAMHRERKLSVDLPMG
jgi:hypothetical protein